jgi:hypothetical protein
LTGKNFAELLHPDDREARILIARQMTAGEIDHFKIASRYPRMDGTNIWVYEYVAITRSSDGTPMNMLAMVSALSDRKHGEHGGWVRDERLRDVIQPAPVAMAILDNEMRYLACSKELGRRPQAR